MQKTTPALGLALACTLSLPAAAHPHVFADMRSAISFTAAGQVDAITISWTFDKFYTQAATENIDRNENRKFDPEELQSLADAYALNLKELRHFTFIQLDGRLIENGTPSNPRATIKDGQLTFSFRMPLAKPVDPSLVKFTYSSFDPTYYVDIAPQGSNPVTLAGAPKGCTTALRKIDTTKPGALALARIIKMSPPTSDVLNATSASIVDLTCPRLK